MNSFDLSFHSDKVVFPLYLLNGSSYGNNYSLQNERSQNFLQDCLTSFSPYSYPLSRYRPFFPYGLQLRSLRVLPRHHTMTSRAYICSSSDDIPWNIYLQHVKRRIRCFFSLHPQGQWKEGKAGRTTVDLSLFHQGSGTRVSLCAPVREVTPLNLLLVISRTGFPFPPPKSVTSHAGTKVPRTQKVLRFFFPTLSSAAKG